MRTTLIKIGDVCTEVEVLTSLLPAIYLWYTQKLHVPIKHSNRLCRPLNGTP
jgi:hypothetical protein